MSKRGEKKTILLPLTFLSFEFKHNNQINLLWRAFPPHTPPSPSPKKKADPSDIAYIPVLFITAGDRSGERGKTWPTEVSQAGGELPQARSGELRGRGAGPPARPAARPRWQQSTALGCSGARMRPAPESQRGETSPVFSLQHTLLKLVTLPPPTFSLDYTLITWTSNTYTHTHPQKKSVKRFYLFSNCFAWLKGCELKGEYRNVFSLNYLRSYKMASPEWWSTDPQYNLTYFKENMKWGNIKKDYKNESLSFNIFFFPRLCC